MGTEFDLNRALFLTYVGVGAAFLVLGSLVIFTGLIGRWGSWRLKRAQAREAETAAQVETESGETAPAVEPAVDDPGLAAAIGAAVALAIDAQQREQAAEDRQREMDSPANGGSWREQGRLAAFDSRRVRERDR